MKRTLIVLGLVTGLISGWITVARANVNCRAVEETRVESMLGGDVVRSNQLLNYYLYYCNGDIHGQFVNGQMQLSQTEVSEPLRIAAFEDVNYPDCLAIGRQYYSDMTVQQSLNQNKQFMDAFSYWCLAHDIGGAGAIANRMAQVYSAQQEQEAAEAFETILGMAMGMRGGVAHVPHPTYHPAMAAPRPSAATPRIVAPATPQIPVSTVAPRPVVTAPQQPTSVQVGHPGTVAQTPATTRSPGVVTSTGGGHPVTGTTLPSSTGVVTSGGTPGTSSPTSASGMPTNFVPLASAGPGSPTGYIVENGQRIYYYSKPPCATTAQTGPTSYACTNY